MTGNMTAQSFITASDQSIKTDVQSVSTDVCLNMLQSIEAKTYQRTDLETTAKRVGFLSQDVQQFSTEFPNLTAPISESILGLDYSRLTPILWTLAKKQEEDIENLTVRLTALEKPKTTKSKKSSD